MMIYHRRFLKPPAAAPPHPRASVPCATLGAAVQQAWVDIVIQDAEPLSLTAAGKTILHGSDMRAMCHALKEAGVDIYLSTPEEIEVRLSEFKNLF